MGGWIHFTRLGNVDGKIRESKKGAGFGSLSPNGIVMLFVRDKTALTLAE
jgi:hypothetical protein